MCTWSAFLLDLLICFASKFDIDSLHLECASQIIEIVNENLGLVEIQGEIESCKSEFVNACLHELDEWHRLLGPFLDLGLRSKRL